MLTKRIVCLVLALLGVLGLAAPAFAAEVDSEEVYCFTPADFGEELAGICVVSLPDAGTGTVMLGARVLRPGDILTAGQLENLTFFPLATQEDKDAVMTFLPIYEGRVDSSATVTISIHGREDKAPVAEDFALETYKNLPNEGILKVTDPEGKAMTYTLLRQPKRGQVELRDDGSFVYTPKKNKVGVDSFTYTATDPAGNVSREATVTIQILKPTDSQQYADTQGRSCGFAAEWMRSSGLFEGEKVGGMACFHPDKVVSRGEFLTMLIKALRIPTEDVSGMASETDVPDWLKPYLAAALRAGLTAGLPGDEDTGSFDPMAPITGGEAAVLLQNALDLELPAQPASLVSPDAPAWAVNALAALAEEGIALDHNAPMTREQVALTMYQVSLLAESAPGTAVFRMQK